MGKRLYIFNQHFHSINRANKTYIPVTPSPPSPPKTTLDILHTN